MHTQCLKHHLSSNNYKNNNNIDLFLLYNVSNYTAGTGGATGRQQGGGYCQSGVGSVITVNTPCVNLMRFS